MRTRGFLCLAAAALLAACDGPRAPAAVAQQLTTTGRRIIANGDLTQPRFSNGGPNSFLTVTGLDQDGFETVFVLNAIWIDFEVVSRADTVLDQATGLDIEPQPNDDSRGGTPSQDGAFAAYLSEATNLLESRPTTFERQHVYLRDVNGESNELISVGSAPQPGNESRILLPDTRPIPEANDHSSSAVLSADGRFVVFASRATDIVPLGKNGLSQIYVYDGDFRSMELITRVAIGADVFPGNGSSFAPYIATTGHFVVYQSDASNLILGDTNNGRDIFVFNRSARTTERLNIDPGGTGTLFDPGPPKISPDGNIVVFSARPTPTGVRQIYVRDRAAATTTLISKNVPGAPGDDDSAAPGLNEEGRFVVFQSDATNLVAGDTNGLTDIFVYDIWSDRIARVNVNVNSVQADGESLTPTISANGTVIAFVSRALNLVMPTEGEPFPPNRTLDLYVFANPLLP
ncbi:MAG: TolB family protein [Planctomycetota bacterium]